MGFATLLDSPLTTAGASDLPESEQQAPSRPLDEV